MEIKLFDCFKDLEDPRRLTHILHPARNIIYIAFTAILCGMRTWEDIEDFGNERIEFFEKRLDLSHGIPSHDTFDRFFQIIDSKVFARYFANWASAVAGEAVCESHASTTFQPSTLRVSEEKFTPIL